MQLLETRVQNSPYLLQWADRQSAAPKVWWLYFHQRSGQSARWEEDSASLSAVPTRVSGGTLAAQRVQCLGAGILCSRFIHESKRTEGHICNMYSTNKYFSHKFNVTQRSQLHCTNETNTNKTALLSSKNHKQRNRI